MLNKLSNIINITNNAWYKIFNISQKLNTNNFLLSVSSGGCNGYNYNLKSIDNEKYKKDNWFNFGIFNLIYYFCFASNASKGCSIVCETIFP